MLVDQALSTNLTACYLLECSDILLNYTPQRAVDKFLSEIF
jgi:hypothetical protein